MIPYSQTMVMSLEDAFPDSLDGKGIFDYLHSFAWNPDSSSALTFNIEYYYNRSGRKMASPLVSRLIDSETGALVAQEVEQLARIITTRYSAKWSRIWDTLASDFNLFSNVNIQSSIEYGKETESTSNSTLTKSGSETSTLQGSEIREETFPTAMTTTRKVTGGWKDAHDMTSTRTGTEDVTESYPTARTVTKKTTGGYADTNTTATTRTGTQKVTDKGDTQVSTYGFNSASPVPTTKSGPYDTTAGVTTETSYDSLKDSNSGAITRNYNSLQEETSETGSKKLSTTYGDTGLKDSDTGDVTRQYNNYQEETSQSGSHRTETSYGNSGKTDTLSFNDRSDTTSATNKTSNSGTDTKTQSGYNIKLSDKFDIITALYENPRLNDFFEIVYADIDSILTCPIFV